MELEFVPREHLHIVWGWIRPRLDDVLRKTEEPWIPEDIYLALKTQAAGLYMAVSGGKLIGFMVAQVVTDFDLSKHFLIWVAYGDMKPIVKEALLAAETIARQMGCAEMRFRSPRRGWERAYPGMFKVKEVVYTREIGGLHEQRK